MLLPIDFKSGEPDWSALQNTSIGDALRLQDFLGADGSSAVFRAELAEVPGSTAVVKFYRVEQDPVAESQAETWEEARQLNHPNLIKILAAGRATLGDRKLIYVAVEPADESLASALRERALEPDEAGQVLTSTRNALEYLHRHGFVHSCLSPEQIFAVGDWIKLSTESLRKIDSTRSSLGSSAKYLAPEANGANVSPAADVWCLGATLVEALTLQSVSSGNWNRQAVPFEFRSVVERCLIRDPNLRPGLAQIGQEKIAAPRDKPTTTMPDLAALPHVVRPEPPKMLYRRPERAGFPFWAYALGSVVLIAAIIWLFRTSSSGPKAPAAPQKTLPAAQQKTIQPTGEPAATPPAATSAPLAGHEVAGPQQSARPGAEKNGGRKGSVWRVVIYTYSQESAAKQKADEINEKHPELHASAFSPNGKPHFLVTVGGTMSSREEASKFRQNAVRLGMPGDAYIQNYMQ
ncbi:MAG: protein kinase [Bryobacteraceae bacterium]